MTRVLIILTLIVTVIGGWSVDLFLTSVREQYAYSKQRTPSVAETIRSYSLQKKNESRSQRKTATVAVKVHQGGNLKKNGEAKKLRDVKKQIDSNDTLAGFDQLKREESQAKSVQGKHVIDYWDLRGLLYGGSRGFVDGMLERVEQLESIQNPEAIRQKIDAMEAQLNQLTSEELLSRELQAWGSSEIASARMRFSKPHEVMVSDPEETR